jgi:hypothetical protein
MENDYIEWNQLICWDYGPIQRMGLHKNLDKTVRMMYSDKRLKYRQCQVRIIQNIKQVSKWNQSFMLHLFRMDHKNSVNTVCAREKKAY